MRVPELELNLLSDVGSMTRTSGSQFSRPSSRLSVSFSLFTPVLCLISLFCYRFIGIKSASSLRVTGSCQLCAFPVVEGARESRRALSLFISLSFLSLLVISAHHDIVPLATKSAREDAYQ